MDDMKQKKPTSVGPAIQIVAGIDDCEAGIWLEFSDGRNHAWIARSDLIGDGQAAFIGLERQGIAAITHAARANIKAQVQGFANYAVDRRVAVRPGWHPPFYVMPDGTVVGPRGCSLAKPIVTFAPNVKCKRSPGNLKNYSDAFGPVVARQSLLLTVIAYSLSGAMLSVMCRSPHAILNTGLDFVGPQNTGKTQLLATAGASWGDDPDVTRGYNDRWSSTVAAAMSRIGMSNDGYGGFDETSVAALKNARKAGSAVEVAAKIMMLSDGAERDRYGGPLHSKPSRVMYVSSGNASLVEYLEGHPDVIAAHETRLITIRTDGVGREGIFDTVPKGFKTAAEAGNKLDWARKSHHGWLGQEFIRRLVDARFKDEAALISTVEAYMEEFHQAAASITRAAPMDRVWRPFALAYATGRLTKKWKLIPADWGSFKKATLNAYRIASEHMEEKRNSSRSIDRLDSLIRYLRVSKLVDVRKSKAKITRKQVASAPGFLHKNKDGQLELLVSSTAFKTAIPDHKVVLATLKSRSLIATEDGKCSVYRPIRGSGKDERDRVYAILVKVGTEQSGGITLSLAY